MQSNVGYQLTKETTLHFSSNLTKPFCNQLRITRAYKMRKKQQELNFKGTHNGIYQDLLAETEIEIT